MALEIDLAAWQTSIRGWGLSKSRWTTSPSCSSIRSRWRASLACRRTLATSCWVAKPMMAETATDSTAERYWLCG